ncbi:MAG: hypothetical protein EA425_06980 [Puniceicoccaceae bacterium]|nr:MAG: hypothetical protein EA425_06980 [Puniceicoccaceae bacterium]
MNERLYQLLPAIHRIRDAEKGGPLRALLAVVESEYDALEGNIDQLYDDWFIETCAEWVVPYIGDLLGVRHLADAGPEAFSRRAFVANTLSYRRRKGTASVIERLARDGSGWPASAVEFFQLLTTSVHLRHVRTSTTPATAFGKEKRRLRNGTVNLRLGDALDHLDRAFDTFSHTADIRKLRPEAGWQNIPHLGVFLWRLRRYPLEAVEPRRSDPPGRDGYHFSPLGNPAPLFLDPETGPDPLGRVGETNVPAPIRCRAFHREQEHYRDAYGAIPPPERPDHSFHYGPVRSLAIFRDGELIPPASIVAMNLAEWARPEPGYVAVDVARGRFTFPEGDDPDSLLVNFNYGFSGDLGGGPYRRAGTLRSAADFEWSVRIGKDLPLETIQQALLAWEEAGKPIGLIEIADNRVYGGNLGIELPPEGTLVIQAAEGRRPDVRLISPLDVTAVEGGGVFELNGLLIEGSLELIGPLNFSLIHSTIVPGRMLSDEGEPENPDRDSITGESAGDFAQVRIERSITGPIRLPETLRGLSVQDSIILAPPVGGVARPAIAAGDGGGAAPPATLIRSTIFGEVHVREMVLASEVIFTAPALADRLQSGCVRFSYVAPGSSLPRRFRCQPELSLVARAKELGLEPVSALPPAERRRIEARIRPLFTSLRYGEPAFAQLHHACPREIYSGAEDGSEMGAFCHLKQSLREANLKACLEDYLKFGIEAGLLFQT